MISTPVRERVLKLSFKIHLWSLLQLEFWSHRCNSCLVHCTLTHTNMVGICKTVSCMSTCIPVCTQTHAAQISHNLRNVPQASETQRSRKWEGQCGNDVKTIEKLCDSQCVCKHSHKKKMISAKEGLLLTSQETGRTRKCERLHSSSVCACVYVWEKEINGNANKLKWVCRGCWMSEIKAACVCKYVCEWMRPIRSSCVCVSDLELL